MKTRETEPLAVPDDAELAALRAWYAGLVSEAAEEDRIHHDHRE